MSTKQTEALKLALEGLEKWHFDKDPRGAADYIAAIREALAHQDSKEKEQSKTDAFIKQIDEALAEQTAQQEPVTNYCKECLTYNGHHEGCSHYTTPPQRKPLTDEKNGSPCPEFWDWLPKAYNFDGEGAFTKYNMEVAFLAGKQSVATNDTSQERVDEIQKHRHDTSPPANANAGKQWVGLTDEEFRAIGQRFENDNGHVQAWMSFARHIQFALKEKNNG